MGFNGIYDGLIRFVLNFSLWLYGFWHIALNPIEITILVGQIRFLTSTKPHNSTIWSFNSLLWKLDEHGPLFIDDKAMLPIKDDDFP